MHLCVCTCPQSPTAASYLAVSWHLVVQHHQGPSATPTSAQPAAVPVHTAASVCAENRMGACVSVDQRLVQPEVAAAVLPVSHQGVCIEQPVPLVGRCDEVHCCWCCGRVGNAAAAELMNVLLI